MNSNYKRLYINQSLKLGDHITITNKQYHYIKNVLRIKKNEFLRLFNGKQGEWLAKIEKVEKNRIFLIIEKKIKNQINSPDIWLLFSLIKKDRLNIVVQKATELGIKKIFPIQTDRVNIKNININNLRRNAVEASQQSERLDIPDIYDKKKLDDVFTSWSNDRCILYCDEQSLKVENIIDKLNKIKSKFKKWSVIIGPEGGFTSAERKKILKLQNVYSVTLGKRILRSDTAATVALYCIQQFIDI